MHLISLSLLLLAPWSALAAPSSATRAPPQRPHPKRDLNLPNLPYPPGHTSTNCIRATTNILQDHHLSPQQTLPEPFPATHPLRTTSAPQSPPALLPRAGLPICRQLGAFTFTPSAHRLFSIQAIRLQPGTTYVLSVAASSTVNYLSAYRLGVAPPFRNRVTDARPLQNTGTLRFEVDEVADVVFLVLFQWQFAAGEVALFAIGVAPDR